MSTVKKTYTFTDLSLSENEMNFLTRALTMCYDMDNDMIFDEIPGAFVQPGEEVVIDSDKAKEVRSEINKAMDKLLSGKSVCEKFNVEVTEY